MNVTAAKDVKINSTQFGDETELPCHSKADSEGVPHLQTALNTILGVVDQSLDNIELTSKIKDKASQTTAARDKRSAAGLRKTR